MSTSKQWYTSANLALSDTSTANKMAHSMLWGFGAMLTGNQSGTNGAEGARPSSAYWSLQGSSNSSTSGIDTTDRVHFAGSFTDADWVRAAAASPHTWFVLKSPTAVLDGPWYLCFDFIGPTNDQTGTIVISKNVFSGGSTSARPTSTGEAALTSFQFITTTQAAGKIHLVTDADGNFRFFHSRNGTGYFDVFIGVESMVEYHASDPARAFLGTQFLDSGTGTLTMQQTPAFRGVSTDGTTGLATGLGILDVTFRPAGTSMTQYTTTNSVDSTVDALPCVYMYDNTASHKGIRGRYPDMWAVGAQVAVGSTFPGSGNPERTLVGSYMIAFSVAPSL